MICKHVFISGKVQGVSFRYHTFDRATKLSIKGWVRNLEDGRVEVVAVAESEASMRELIQFLEVGPAAAQVTEIDIRDFDHAKAVFVDFSIRRDGGPTWQT